MNPKDFSWSEDQRVTVTNPTETGFTFKVHNKEYVIDAGQTVKMPGFMAWNAVYGLSSRAAQEAGEFGSWNDEGFKQRYFEQFVVNVEGLVQEVEAEPEIELEEVNDAPATSKAPEPAADSKETATTSTSTPSSTTTASKTSTKTKETAKTS